MHYIDYFFLFLSSWCACFLSLFPNKWYQRLSFTGVIIAESFTSKFKVERFDEKGSFSLWQRRVKDILVQQGSARALKGKNNKPQKMTEKEWDDLNASAPLDSVLLIILSIMLLMKSRHQHCEKNLRNSILEKA